MNLDDTRLSSLMGEGKNGDIVVLGCPFDFARKRTIQKGGEENGPCCLRRFFSRVGPIYNSEYSIDLNKVKVTDAGNISLQLQENQHGRPQRCLVAITEQVYNILKNKRIPFVFGGSKEGMLGCARAFHKQYTGKHLLIAGRTTCKRPYDGDKLTSDSALRILMYEFPQKVILFGTQIRYIHQKCLTENLPIVTLQQIRATKFTHSDQINTQAGHALFELLRNSSQMYHVSLSVEAIEQFRGCRDTVCNGLSNEEILQMFYLLGSFSSIVSIDISEFNPSCEDYESSLLLVNLLYYFLMGWTKRSSA